MKIPLNFDFQQLLLHLLNFVVLFGILYFLLYSPVKKFMAKRADYYKKLDDEANQKLIDAEKKKELYEEKLSSAEKEIEEKYQDALKSTSDKMEELIQNAKIEADEIIASANKKAESERQKIMENAQSEIVDIVASAADKIIETSTSDSYDSFLNEAERGFKNE